jgi:hypothetical protein
MVPFYYSCQLCGREVPETVWDGASDAPKVCGCCGVELSGDFVQLPRYPHFGPDKRVCFSKLPPDPYAKAIALRLGSIHDDLDGILGRMSYCNDEMVAQLKALTTAVANLAKATGSHVDPK